jgi:hydroxypyruvate isomerase
VGRFVKGDIVVMAIQQSVAWWCYENRGLVPGEFMRAIAAIGYRGIELLPPEYFQLAKEHNLQIVTIQGHYPLEVGLNKREHFEGIEAKLQERLAWARTWQIPNLIVFSGNRAGQGDEAGLAITVDNLKRLMPLAEAAGITLLLELLNSKVDHPDYMADATAWGVEVCRRISSPRLKLLYDIYHMQVMEGDIIQTIRQYHDYIGHYHTAGVPGRADIDETQELNYPAIMEAIRQSGFTGYVGQEFLPAGEAIAALTRAYEICGGGERQ